MYLFISFYLHAPRELKKSSGRGFQRKTEERNSPFFKFQQGNSFSQTTHKKRSTQTFDEHSKKVIAEPNGTIRLLRKY